MIDMLAEMLKQYAPERDYTLFGDRDESVCLTEEADGYHVYYSERGQRSCETVTKDIEEACRIVIHMMSDTDAEEDAMLADFEERLTLK